MKLHGNLRLQGRGWGMARRTWFWGALLVWLALGKTAAAWAEDDEYNFSWLDPEKKIYVLQNRRYQKTNRALLSAMVGVGWSNPYRTIFNIDPRVAYYFTETLGVEFFYEVVSNSENTTYEALKKASPTLLPQIREITGQYGALLHWAPWYAKINVFNQVLYFDWYLQFGAGSVNSRVDTNTNVNTPSRFQDQSLFAIYVGTGHQYHLSQNWVVRLDVLGSFYNAPAFGTTGEKKWFSNYNFTAGVGLRL